MAIWRLKAVWSATTHTVEAIGLYYYEAYNVHIDSDITACNIRADQTVFPGALVSPVP